MSIRTGSRKGVHGRRRTARAIWQGGMLTFVTATLVGCYQYSAATISAVPVGAQVRVRVSPLHAGQLLLDDIFGFETRTIDGEVIGVGSDTLQLLVTVPTRMMSGVGPTGLSQRLFVPVEGISELEIRGLDRIRTGLVGGAGVAGILLVMYMQFSGWFGGDIGPPETPKEFTPHGCCGSGLGDVRSAHEP